MIFHKHLGRNHSQVHLLILSLSPLVHQYYVPFIKFCLAQVLLPLYCRQMCQWICSDLQEKHIQVSLLNIMKRRNFFFSKNRRWHLHHVVFQHLWRATVKVLKSSVRNTDSETLRSETLLINQLQNKMVHQMFPRQDFLLFFILCDLH